MCSGSNLRRCFRMCSTHAMVNRRFVPRVCECLPVQWHHQHVDGRRPCFATHRDVMAGSNKSPGEATYCRALRKSDCVSFPELHRIPGVLGVSTMSNGKPDLTIHTPYRVPFLVLPSLTTARGYLQDHTDRTWEAVTPTIWLQISLNMSLFTACIPSLRGLIESILVSTTAGAIQAPYNLTRTGAGYGMRATAIPLQELDSSRYFRSAKRHGLSLKTYISSGGIQEEGLSHQPEGLSSLVGHEEAGRSVYRALSSSHGSSDR